MAKTRIKETCTGFQSIYGKLDDGLSYHNNLCARCTVRDGGKCSHSTTKTVVAARA